MLRRLLRCAADAPLFFSIQGKAIQSRLRGSEELSVLYFGFHLDETKGLSVQRTLRYKGSHST